MFSLLQKKGVTKKEIHKFIKKTGKDILSTKDESGQTIVHICASEGKIDILDFLLNKYKNNLNLDMKDNLGWTPLVCAAHNAQLSAIELLLKHNADPNIKTNDEAICLHYFAKIKVNSKDVGYYTSVAKQLVKKISNLDVQNKIGETPLHKAARDGVVEFVKILIEHGANPNLQDINGYTPLHVAASVGEVDVVSALLNGKTDTTLRSNDGTAREIAQAKNFVKIVQMIDDFEKTHNLRSSTATLPKSKNIETRRMSILDRKFEIWTQIFSHLDFEDVLSASEVCKEWHAIATSDQIWFRFYQQQQQQLLAVVKTEKFITDNSLQTQNTMDRIANPLTDSHCPQTAISNQNSHSGIYKKQFIQMYLQEMKDPKFLMFRLREVKRKLRRTEEELGRQVQQLSSELTKQKINAEQMEKKLMVLLLVQNRYVKLKEKYKLQEKKLQQIESICDFRGQQIKELRASLMEKEKELQQLRHQLTASSSSASSEVNELLSSSPRSSVYSSSVPVNIPSSIKKERRSSAQRSKPQPLWRSTEPETLDQDPEKEIDKESKRKRSGRSNFVNNLTGSAGSESPRMISIASSIERDFKHFMVTPNTSNKNISSSPPSKQLSQLLASHILDDEEMDANFLEAVITAEEEFRHHRAIMRNEEMGIDKDEKKKVVDVKSPKRSPNNSRSHIEKITSKRSSKETSSPTNEREESAPVKKVSFSLKESTIISSGTSGSSIESNLKKDSKVSHKEDEDVGSQSTSSPGTRSPISSRPTRVTKEKKRVNDWELNFGDLLFEEKIGTGASATVYKGTYKNQEVGIKILRMTEVAQEKDIKDFEKELEIMKIVRANNIVQFIGATLEPKFCIVLEYCPRGSVHAFLKNMNNDLPWELFFKWSIQTCQGILVLHSWQPSPIVHRDLKTPNLLIDKDWNIKLCDFGLSRFVTGNEKDGGTLAKFRGTYCYMATEIYFKDQYSVRSDIYSLGIVLWEMLHKCMTGKYEKPYSEYKFIRYDIQIPVQAATKGLRPTIPPNTPPIVADLIKSCWQSDPQLRPTCAQILQILEQAKKEYEANPEKWNSVRVVPKRPTWN